MCLVLCFFFALITLVSPETLVPSEASDWLKQYNKEATELFHDNTIVHWNYNTNITDYNANQTVISDGRAANFSQKNAVIAKSFDIDSITDESIKRQLKMISKVGIVLDEGDQMALSEIKNSMVGNYGIGSVCSWNKETMEEDCSKKLSLSELTKIMETDPDYDHLLHIWKGWRDVAGKPIAQDYENYVRLSNKGARADGYEDAGDLWRSAYEDPNMNEDLAMLWKQLLPLYEQLHTYVRTRLKRRYPGRLQSASIPAHILGNMWGQHWANLYNFTAPFPEKRTIDITEEMKRQNVTEVKIFEIADNMFKSLGMLGVPDEFWTKSMLVKPADGRSVVCHASAWDFFDSKDWRIKMCTQVTMNEWYVVHHEMGHVQYFMQYTDHSSIFKNGANPGFHEGVADTLALSAVTPSYLKTLGLLPDYTPDPQQDINYLYRQALDKLAFIPFGYLVDLWRWKVFDGTLDSTNWNQGWWDLREKFQGLVPPVPRSDNDFDPGAKFHVPASSQYIAYFISHILQFQLYKALCDAAGWKGPLFTCDLYGNKAAGDRFAAMLQLGSSKHWRDALEPITGQRNLSALPLLEYFQPLMVYLEQANRGQCFGWGIEWPNDYKLAVPRCGKDGLPLPPENPGTLTAAAIAMNALWILLVLGFTIGIGILLWKRGKPTGKKDADAVCFSNSKE